MPHSAIEYLCHIRDEARYLASRAGGLDQETFLADETLKRAFARSIEIIGEAAKQVPDAVRAMDPKVEWRRMAGMRDRVAHDYMGVDYDIVWLIASQKAAPLAMAMDILIARLPASA